MAYAKKKQKAAPSGFLFFGVWGLSGWRGVDVFFGVCVFFFFFFLKTCILFLGSRFESLKIFFHRVQLCLIP